MLSIIKSIPDIYGKLLNILAFSFADIVFLGIIFDFIAAVFFIKNILENSIKDVLEINASLWGPNYNRIKDGIRMLLDTRIGFVFFILGFLMQSFSFFADVYLQNARHLQDFVIGVIIGTVSLLILNRLENVICVKTIKAEYGSHIKEELERELGKKEMNDNLIRYYGRVFELKKKESESLLCFGERILEGLE